MLDFFAGSGTAAVAQKMGRRFVMIDRNDEALAVMARRLGTANVGYVDDRFRPLPAGPSCSPSTRAIPNAASGRQTR